MPARADPGRVRRAGGGGSRARDAGRSRAGEARRLVVVADVGGPDDVHVGDEAMLEANLAWLRQLSPAPRLTVLSRDPAWTATRYGVESVAAPDASTLRDPAATGPGGDWSASRRARAAAGWRLGEDVVSAIRGADGLLVSGGGNLCASWPDKLLERVAAIHCARDHGRPVAVVGQTLGPVLTPAQEGLVGRALSRAAFVGVRDRSSLELAARLGVRDERLGLQVDDAFFLDPEPVDDTRLGPLAGLRGTPWILLTLDASLASPENAGRLECLAGQLDALAEALDAALVFVPHVGGSRVPERARDAVTARTVADHLHRPLRMVDLWQPREVLWLTGQATLVVSSRYHPLVFATASGVPAMGIHSDPYTRVKLRAALGHAGLEPWAIGLDAAAGGSLLPQALELSRRRAEIRSRCAGLRERAWAEEHGRRQRVLRALAMPVDAAGPESRPVGPAATIPDPPGEGVAPMLERLTDEQWSQFERQGYLRLGAVLDPGQLSALRERLDAIVRGEIRYPALQVQLDTGGRYEELPEATAGLPAPGARYRKIQGLEADPRFLELIQHERFREIAGRLYGAHASISIFRAMIMNKPEGLGTHLPWHQDGGDVWKLDRDPVMTVWIALDPATRANGCLEIVPGSHRLGLLSRHGSTLSPEHAARHAPDEAVVCLEVQAGEAIVFHNWLLHRSGVNPTDTPRRAVTVCYMDGRTLNTTTGAHFPMVFGAEEDPESTMGFLRVLREENRLLRASRAEAERYARSLAEERQRLAAAHGEAERYAASLLEENRRLARDAAEMDPGRRAAEASRLALEGENARLRASRAEAEQYAMSLREECQRLAAAHGEAERYAASLLEENRRLARAVQDLEQHARSVEAETQRFVASLRDENQRLSEARLDAERWAQSLDAERRRAREGLTGRRA